jgi:hypothetical protein
MKTFHRPAYNKIFVYGISNGIPMLNWKLILPPPLSTAVSAFLLLEQNVIIFKNTELNSAQIKNTSQNTGMSSSARRCAVIRLSTCRGSATFGKTEEQVAFTCLLSLLDAPNKSLEFWAHTFKPACKRKCAVAFSNLLRHYVTCSNAPSPRHCDTAVTVTAVTDIFD